MPARLQCLTIHAAMACKTWCKTHHTCNVKHLALWPNHKVSGTREYSSNACTSLAPMLCYPTLHCMAVAGITAQGQPANQNNLHTAHTCIGTQNEVTCISTTVFLEQHHQFTGGTTAPGPTIVLPKCLHCGNVYVSAYTPEKVFSTQREWYNQMWLWTGLWHTRLPLSCAHPLSVSSTAERHRP